MKLIAASLLLAAALPAAAQHSNPPQPTGPVANPRLVSFYASALGEETVLQFASCTDDAASFVFSLGFSYTTAEQTITVGCLDGRGEPNSTAIRMSRYNRGAAVETRLVWVDIGPDVYAIWRGQPTVNDNGVYFLGYADADNARMAIRAAAAQIRRRRAMEQAEEETRNFPCP